MKVRTGLLSTLGVLSIAALLTAAMGWNNQADSTAALHRLHSLSSQQSRYLKDAYIRGLRSVVQVDMADSADDAGARVELAQEARAFLSQAKAQFKRFLDVPKATDRGREQAADLERKFNAYFDSVDRMAQAVERNDHGGYMSVKKGSISSSAALNDAMTQFDLLVNGYGEDVISQADSQARVMLISMIVLALLVLGVTVAAFLYLNRAVLRPLREAGRHFDRIAAGDLTTRLDARSDNEIGVLLGALKRMQESLTRTVSAVRRGVDEINVGSREISAGNTDLSSRTEQQAASLEETAASMEELASTVKQNADNARQANQLAASASDVAQRGGSAVSEVVSTMEGISASSRKISEIVSVIDGIAFQTNILALNAAVEAARAGEQGKGFAVVAGEVRSLAQRSAQAAKEIKALIEDSVSKVGAGSQQVERAGATMQEIVASVKRVTDIMGEIASASQEQSSGIEQVNRAVSQMDSVTQQNAALVEQAAAAAGSLEEQARRLSDAVAVFRVAAT